jgi:hypothetical protein
MTRLFLAAATAVLIVATAACGDGDSSSSTTRPATAAPDSAGAAEGDQESPPGSSAAADASGGTELTVVDSATDETVTAPVPDDTDTGGEADVTDECRDIAALFSEGEDAGFEEVDELMVELKEFAPDEIDDAIDVMLETIADVTALVEERGLTVEEAEQDEELSAQIDALVETNGAEGASADMQQYFEDKCPSLVP